MREKLVSAVAVKLRVHALQEDGLPWISGPVEFHANQAVDAILDALAEPSEEMIKAAEFIELPEDVWRAMLAKAKE